ncbi:MAG TPA: hypothetical protein VFA75_09010 [Nevskia sp.]|nr:hypothetical protein [Nevskia sp.]
MNPVLMHILIFAGVAIAGMLAHYVKSWAKGEISGNLVDYLFRDNPRSTVLSLGGVLTAVATTAATGTLDGMSLQQLLLSGFTTGFAIDSTLNKGGVVAPAPAAAIGSKQGGFSRLSLLLGTAALSVIGLLLLSAAGCASVPANLQSAAYDAQLTADAAVKQIPILLNSGAITPATATKIRNAAVTVYGAAGAVQGCTAACSTADLDAALAALAALIPQK